MRIDPYLQWLEIPADRRPPTHYDLLGLQPLEFQPARVQEEASRRIAHVRKYQVGAYGEIAQKVINELSQALSCLSDEKRRAAYDREIGGLATLAESGGQMDTWSDAPHRSSSASPTDVASLEVDSANPSLDALSALVQVTSQLPADAPPPMSEVALPALPVNPPDRRLQYAAACGGATALLCLMATGIAMRSPSPPDKSVVASRSAVTDQSKKTPVPAAVNPPLERDAAIVPTAASAALEPIAVPVSAGHAAPNAAGMSQPTAVNGLGQPQPATIPAAPNPARVGLPGALDLPAAQAPTAQLPPPDNLAPGGQPAERQAPGPPAVAPKPAVADNANAKPAVDVQARLREVTRMLKVKNYLGAQQILREVDALDLNKDDRTDVATLQKNLARIAEKMLLEAKGLKNSGAARFLHNAKLDMVMRLDPDGPSGAEARKMLNPPVGAPTGKL